jgi:hypothetical protein
VGDESVRVLPGGQPGARGGRRLGCAASGSPSRRGTPVRIPSGSGNFKVAFLLAQPEKIMIMLQ